MNEEDYPKEIGLRIAKARKARDWTLDELAAASGIKKTTISNYERGIRTPGPFEITQLANAAAVSAAYLMCLEDVSPGPTIGLNPRVENLPEVFKEAIRLKAERLIKICAALPISVITMFKAPTSDNYLAWERGIEDSYRSFTGKTDLLNHSDNHVTYGRRSTDTIKGK